MMEGYIFEFVNISPIHISIILISYLPSISVNSLLFDIVLIINCFDYLVRCAAHNWCDPIMNNMIFFYDVSV